MKKLSFSLLALLMVMGLGLTMSSCSSDDDDSSPSNSIVGKWISHEVDGDVVWDWSVEFKSNSTGHLSLVKTQGSSTSSTDISFSYSLGSDSDGDNFVNILGTHDGDLDINGKHYYTVTGKDLDFFGLYWTKK